MARITALVGGSIFLIGATLAYFEALNVHPKADRYIPSFYSELHKTGAKMKSHLPTTSPQSPSSTQDSPAQNSPSTQNPSSPVQDSSGSQSPSTSFPQNPSSPQNPSPPQHLPSLKSAQLSPSASSPPVPSSPTLEDPTSPRAFSIVSDSYNPNSSSHVPSPLLLFLPRHREENGEGEEGVGKSRSYEDDAPEHSEARKRGDRRTRRRGKKAEV